MSIQNGFVKAFSESPQSFTAGFCQVERIMKSLFVKQLFLWPRFHASVSACFDRHTVEVVELHLKMTPAMTACQVALLDLIDACIKEIKRSNQAVNFAQKLYTSCLNLFIYLIYLKKLLYFVSLLYIRCIRVSSNIFFLILGSVHHLKNTFLVFVA